MIDGFTARQMKKGPRSEPLLRSGFRKRSSRSGFNLDPMTVALARRLRRLVDLLGSFRFLSEVAETDSDGRLALGLAELRRGRRVAFAEVVEPDVVLEGHAVLGSEMLLEEADALAVDHAGHLAVADVLERFLLRAGCG